MSEPEQGGLYRAHMLAGSTLESVHALLSCGVKDTVIMDYIRERLKEMADFYRPDQQDMP